jgi:hypothetical protein
MIWNTIPNEERLHLWKKLRDDIKELPLTNQLDEIAKFCSKMPFGARTLDYYSPENWPTPWEILFHGSFCTSSISLLMFYTLELLSAEPKIELYLVEDDDGIFLLPIINDQFILNYELGAVNKYSEIQDDFRVLQKYTKEQIKNIT